jgi:hypothetical protein
MQHGPEPEQIQVEGRGISRWVECGRHGKKPFAAARYMGRGRVREQHVGGSYPPDARITPLGQQKSRPKADRITQRACYNAARNRPDRRLPCPRSGKDTRGGAPFSEQG